MRIVNKEQEAISIGKYTYWSQNFCEKHEIGQKQTVKKSEYKLINFSTRNKSVDKS